MVQLLLYMFVHSIVMGFGKCIQWVGAHKHIIRLCPHRAVWLILLLGSRQDRAKLKWWHNLCTMKGDI